MQNTKKYVVTRFIEDYDPDGLTNYFTILGIFFDREKAIEFSKAEILKFIKDKTKEDEGWLLWEKDLEKRIMRDPNKHNKKIHSVSCKIGYKEPNLLTWINVFIDVLEVPFDAKIDESLFNPDECGYVIRSYFERLKSDEEKPLKMQKTGNLDRTPYGCHLWQSKQVDEDDLLGRLKPIKTYVEESYFSRRLMKCIKCGRLYLKEFYEEIDWVDGDDPQYNTYVPVLNENDAETVNKLNYLEIHTITPRIKLDWPKGEDRKAYWVGRVD